MTRFKHTFSRRTCVAVLAATAVLGAAVATQASTPYDGNWNVVIRAGNGECKTSSIPLRIQNGSVAYNFFRLAAILQGIVGRVRDGTASNENAAAMASEVRPLAAAAWDWAVKAGAR